MTRRGLFRPRAQLPAAAEAKYAAFELAYTAVDVVAGLLFVGGSALFLVGGHDVLARILFLAGSCLFVAKPLIRLGRELALAGEGETDELAARGGSHVSSAGHGPQAERAGETPSGMGDAWDPRHGRNTRRHRRV